MNQRIHRPNPQPPRPPPPGDGKDAPDRLRLARVLLLKASIRKGLYDADSKINGILDGLVKEI